jgi:acetyltransferase-like isoleucine patch superfamily enzyme
VAKLDFPSGGRIEADSIEGCTDVQIGPAVTVVARRLIIGRGVRIGMLDDDDSFRFPAGTRIELDELVLGDNVRIGRHVLIRGGRIEIKRDSRIGNMSTIKVKSRLVLGEHGIMNEQCEIAGVDIEIGRELWMLPTAKIGGGSAFEVHSRLRAGHWLHLGMRTLVNTARPVVLGNEVGLGTGTSLYTHGAYPSALDGKPAAFGPISIGDRSWLPGAIVNPSVDIGPDCVVGVGSVVNRDLPAGCLAAGIPAKVIKENAYVHPLAGAARQTFIRDLVRDFGEICTDRHRVEFSEASSGPRARVDNIWIGYLATFEGAIPTLDGASAAVVLTDEALEPISAAPCPTTVIDLTAKHLDGPATELTERLLNQMRRYGVRFYYEAREGRYLPWV